MGLPRENIYGLAKLWLSKDKNRVSMERYDSKHKRIDAKLRRANIIKDLLSTCSNCKVPHTCLDPFRKCPDAVLTWRTHVVPCSLPAFFHLVSLLRLTSVSISSSRSLLSTSLQFHFAGSSSIVVVHAPPQDTILCAPQIRPPAKINTALL